MADAAVQDLLALDRDVARGVSALEAWREALASNPDAAAEVAPLEPVRRVASRTTWAALGEATPSLADLPLRDALRQWVVALTQARVGLPAELAWARAVAAPRGRLEGASPRSVSWREAWRGVVAAPALKDAARCLEAAAMAAPEVAETARAMASRRLEVARRFGMEHPWEALVGVRPAAVRRAARALLDATEEISQEAWRPVWRVHGDGVATTLHEAVARAAGDGWPARLTPRWLAERFPGLATREVVAAMAPLPASLGAASFARALGAFGRAVRLAGRMTAPFALAREPAFTGAYRLGFVFAGLAAEAEWHTRALALGRKSAAQQARMLARSGLLEARLLAARLLLGDEAAFAPADAFEELGARLFGAPLDARLRGAWPAARTDEPARFVGLLQAPGAAKELRDSFDADWFRNPRAMEHLRAGAAAPAREPLEESALGPQVAALARAFEEALG
jgi:hypothetical protein